MSNRVIFLGCQPNITGHWKCEDCNDEVMGELRNEVAACGMSVGKVVEIACIRNGDVYQLRASNGVVFEAYDGNVRELTPMEELAIECNDGN